jgi:signal transduction histidine kinase
VRNRRAGFRTLLYLLLALPLGAVTLAVMIAGWVLCTLSAVTPLAPAALGAFRAVIGGLVRIDMALSESLLEITAGSPTRSPGRLGYWRGARNVLADPVFWKQQVYLLQRLVLGFALAIAELALLTAGVGGIAQPIDYRWMDTSFGSWHLDSLGRAFLFVPVGVLSLVLFVALVRPFGALARSLIVMLLDGHESAQATPFAHTREMRVRLLGIHTAVFVGVSAFTSLIWVLASRGYFWPIWPMLVVGVPLAMHAWVGLVDLRPAVASRQRLTRGLAIQEGLSVAFVLFLVVVWAITSRGYLWPVWPLLVLLVAFGIHAGVTLGPAIRRGALAERIASLETSRAGVVDQQESELRRIERDLHDGAQARIVALGMSLGMAEQKLASDPDGAREMLADARRGAREALEELRDLARGIHPPVLADRGLEAAIAALASRTPLHVRVSVDLDRRPAAPVESAAYFIVAEALANVGKHAQAEHVDIAVRRRNDAVIVEVVDDGVGGARLSGSGLQGLTRRVEALDGSLEIASPAGGPTTLKAVMPCGS